MTINEAINAFKQANPGTKLTFEQMVQELSRLDLLVKENVIDTHEGGSVDFHGYDDSTDGDTLLLVDEPHDVIYTDWLTLKNELFAKDYKRYNNAATIFDTNYKAFAASYNRSHMPKGTGIKFR